MPNPVSIDVQTPVRVGQPSSALVTLDTQKGLPRARGS